MTLSIDKYLSLCGEIEKNIAQICSVISRTHGMDDRARKVWTRMKLEEDDHFAQIEMLRRLLKSSANEAESLDDGYVAAMLERVKRSCERISAGGVDLQEAIEIVIKLEEECRDFHAGQAYCVEDSGLERVFANLSSQDQNHARQLQDLYQLLYR